MTTRVERCRVCGGLFGYLARGVCGGCLERQEQDYERVRDYVRERRGAGVAEVAAAAEVDEAQVVAWVREGRLETLSGVPAPATCELCGSPTKGGARCADCNRRLLSGFRDPNAARAPTPAPPPPPPPERSPSPRMHSRRRG